MAEYIHKGWIATQYESDFLSYWGLIPLNTMIDCRGCWNNNHALEKAKQNGFYYFIAPKPSKYLNQLYLDRSGRPRCIYAELDYLERAANRAKSNYGNDMTKRVHMLLRVLKYRAKQKH